MRPDARRTLPISPTRSHSRSFRPKRAAKSALLRGGSSRGHSSVDRDLVERGWHGRGDVEGSSGRERLDVPHPGRVGSRGLDLDVVDVLSVLAMVDRGDHDLSERAALGVEVGPVHRDLDSGREALLVALLLPHPGLVRGRRCPARQDEAAASERRGDGGDDVAGIHGQQGASTAGRADREKSSISRCRSTSPLSRAS
jgi:hypothetical protein